jgi:hypothetical protein
MVFNADSVAYRFRGLFGDSFEIVGVLPMTVPVITFSADLEFLEKDNYPLINEMLLNLVSSGFRDPTEIAQLLGVDFKIISGAVLEEEGKGNLYINFLDEKLRISPLGQSVLASLDSKPRVKSNTTWHQDLVTGVFRQHGGVRMGIYSNLGHLKKEVNDDSTANEIISINAENANFKFEESAFTKKDVNEALDKTQKKKEFCSQVLKVSGYKEKPQVKLGFLILFHDTVNDEKRAATVVDGEVRDEHLQSLEDSGEIQRLFDLIAKIEPSELPEGKVTSILETAIAHELPKIDKSLVEEAIAEKILEPQQLFDATPVRCVFVEDLAKFIPEALQKAKTRILIISPFLSGKVVNKGFISKLKELDNIGVQIDIGIGIDDMFKDNEQYSVSLLKDFAESSKNANVYHWKSHEKMLIADTHMSSGSYNWLSFGGVTENHFRREHSWCFSDKGYVDPWYAHFKKELTEQAIEIWSSKS